MDKKTILIIEDDPEIGDLYKQKFISEGFNVILQAEGAQGLETAKQVKPDIILLDILLESHDGFAVLQNLKAMPDTANIPVAITSNISEGEEVNRALSMGAVKYFMKADYTPAEVAEEIGKLIK